MKYFLLAFMGLCVAGTLYFLLVMNINAPPIDNFFTISYGLLMAFAILRYRLWDLRLLLREATKYLISSGLIGILCFGAILVLTGNSYIGLIVFGLCLFMPFVHSKTYAWITTLRVRSGVEDPKRVDKIKTLADRIKEAGYKISDLAVNVTQICLDEFPAEKCAMLVYEHDKGAFELIRLSK